MPYTSNSLESANSHPLISIEWLSADLFYSIGVKEPDRPASGFGPLAFESALDRPEDAPN